MFRGSKCYLVTITYHILVDPENLLNSRPIRISVAVISDGSVDLKVLTDVNYRI